MAVEIDFSTDIVPGKSLGGIELGANVSEYVDGIYSRFQVDLRRYSAASGPCSLYILDGVVRIAVNERGEIYSIGCNEHYQGKVAGRRLFPGQTFGDVCAATARQRIFNGSLILDDDFGLCFVLPSPYDEIADELKDVPRDLVLSEIYVSDFSSWRV